MFFYDTDKHNVLHIHAEYPGQVAVYSILDGTVLAGELPPDKHKPVVAWVEIHLHQPGQSGVTRFAHTNFQLCGSSRGNHAHFCYAPN